VLRERGFELKGRLVSERRVQPVLIVDLCDEVIDAAAGIADVDEGITLTVHSIALRQRQLKCTVTVISMFVDEVVGHFVGQGHGITGSPPAFSSESASMADRDILRIVV
jgi:hypothetical protein